MRCLVLCGKSVDVLALDNRFPGDCGAVEWRGGAVEGRNGIDGPGEKRRGKRPKKPWVHSTRGLST